MHFFGPNHLQNELKCHDRASVRSLDTHDNIYTQYALFKTILHTLLSWLLFAGVATIQESRTHTHSPQIGLTLTVSLLALFSCKHFHFSFSQGWKAAEQRRDLMLLKHSEKQSIMLRGCPTSAMGEFARAVELDDLFIWTRRAHVSGSEGRSVNMLYTVCRDGFYSQNKQH